MPAALAIGAGLSAAAGIGKTISGASQAKRARRAIESYERAPLENIHQGAQVSRLGADLQAEQQASQSASMLSALRRSGSRGIIGGVGRLATQSNQFNRQIAADLDRQQKEQDILQAQDEARIRMIKEERDRQNLAGLGQDLQQGRSMLWGGIDAIPSAFTGFGENMTGLEE